MLRQNMLSLMSVMLSADRENPFLLTATSALSTYL